MEQTVLEQWPPMEQVLEQWPPMDQVLEQWPPVESFGREWCLPAAPHNSRGTHIRDFRRGMVTVAWNIAGVPAARRFTRDGHRNYIAGGLLQVRVPFRYEYGVPRHAPVLVAIAPGRSICE